MPGSNGRRAIGGAGEITRWRRARRLLYAEGRMRPTPDPWRDVPTEDTWARIVGEDLFEAWSILAELDPELAAERAEPWRRFSLRAVAWALAHHPRGQATVGRLLEAAEAVPWDSEIAASAAASSARRAPTDALSRTAWAAWTTSIAEDAGVVHCADWTARNAQIAIGAPDEALAFSAGVRLEGRIELLQIGGRVVEAWRKKRRERTVSDSARDKASEDLRRRIAGILTDLQEMAERCERDPVQLLAVRAVPEYARAVAHAARSLAAIEDESYEERLRRVAQALEKEGEEP